MASRCASLNNARAQLHCGRPSAPSVRCLGPQRATSGLKIAAPMRLRAVQSDVVTGNVSFIESRADFDDALSQAGDSLVVLDISSSRCGPCKMVFPKFCQMSEDFEDASFFKIEGDTNKETIVRPVATPPPPPAIASHRWSMPRTVCESVQPYWASYIILCFTSVATCAPFLFHRTHIWITANSPRTAGIMSQAMMKEWGVRAVPEFRFFRSGELVHQHSGADADKLRAHIEEHV